MVWLAEFGAALANDAGQEGEGLGGGAPPRCELRLRLHPF